MAAATAFAEERRMEVRAVVIPLSRPSSHAARRRVPRAAAALLAATLTLGLAAGSVAAARAGGPLYGARLTVEAVLLPSGGDARAEAQVSRLEERLAEVGAALASSDSNAASAALDAYASILADLERQAMEDPTIADDVRDDVARHLAVLEGLVTQVPAQARDALEHALAQSGSALDHIDDVGSGRPSTPGSSNPRGGDSGGGQGGNPNGTPPAAQPTPKPAKTPPAAQPTPKPAKTPPAAQPTPKAARTPPAAQPTPKPDRTPPPAADPSKKPSSNPGGPKRTP
jgi:hypothetical protein